MGDPVLQFTCAVLVLLVPVGVRLGWREGSRSSILAMVASAALAAAASAIVATLTSPSTDAAALVLRAALAAAVTGVVALVASHCVGAVPGAALAVVWSLVAHVPLAAAVLDGVPSLVQLVLGAVDYGGVLATHVAAGAALLVVSLLPTRVNLRVRALDDVGWPRAMVGASLVVVGGSAWLLGVEGAITDASGRTLANAVAGMSLACLTWVAVEKIALDRVSPEGVMAGAMVGWGALGAGAPYLSPVALAATAIIATAAAVGAAARPLSRGVSPVRAGSSAVLVAVLVGGIVTTLLADGFGLAETGTLTFTVGQLGAVLAAVVLGAVAGAAGWLLARMVSWWAIPDSN